MSDAQAEFLRQRPRLLAIAYRLLGSASEAEDIVQDAFLRWYQADPATIATPRAWLTTVVTRLCLDHLKSARVQREQYVGPWLPEPVRTDAAEPWTEGAGADDDALAMGVLVLLEHLSPLERAAWVLHEVFDYEYQELAEVLGREPAACRQLVHRARAHLEERRPRFASRRADHVRLVEAFARACERADLAGLERLLAQDAMSWSDGGGKVTAATRPIAGASAVARFWGGLARAGLGRASFQAVEVNGRLALVVRDAGGVRAVVTFECDRDHIHCLRAIVNPDKLRVLLRSL